MRTKVKVQMQAKGKPNWEDISIARFRELMRAYKCGRALVESFLAGVEQGHIYTTAARFRAVPVRRG